MTVCGPGNHVRALKMLFWVALISLLVRTHAFSTRIPSSTPLLRRSMTLSTTSSSVTPTRQPDSVRDDSPIESADAVVCGGGPAGLLTAIMLAQKLPPNHRIRVYDRLSEPPDADDEAIWNEVAKFYLIGLGGRGQAALDEFGVWSGVVEDRCVKVVGRRDWQPDSTEPVERIFSTREKKVATAVLPRDKLVGVLHQHILDKYADRIQLNYGYEVHPVDFEYQDGKAVLVDVAKCDDEIARLNPSTVRTASEKQADTLCSLDNAVRVSTGYLIAADGTVRTVANAMERDDQKRFQAMNPIRRVLAGKPFHIKRFVDDNQRIYKSIPMKLPPDWRADLNYSARAKDATFDALPANTKGDFCGVLLLKKDHPLAQADTNPKQLRKLMDDSFPYFSELIDDETIAQVAKKPVSYLPGFRYAGPRLHQGNRCVLLGDCAHTVKPYFGLGANSALEDVKILGRLLDENNKDLTATIPDFSRHRAADSMAMVRMSRDLDRPGALGFATFILPLILDSMFSKLAPAIFLPNVIAMLQREGWTFARVARRKRLDRFGQAVILGTGFAGAAWAVSGVVRRLASILGCHPLTVTGGGIAGTAVWSLWTRKAGSGYSANMAPADVWAKMSKNTNKNKK